MQFARQDLFINDGYESEHGGSFTSHDKHSMHRQETAVILQPNAAFDGDESAAEMDNVQGEEVQGAAQPGSETRSACDHLF